MSTPLTLHDLASVLATRDGGAYVLTVSEAGGPHTVQVDVVRDGDRLLAVVGPHTADNARRQPRVSLHIRATNVPGSLALGCTTLRVRPSQPTSDEPAVESWA